MCKWLHMTQLSPLLLSLLLPFLSLYCAACASFSLSLFSLHSPFLLYLSIFRWTSFYNFTISFYNSKKLEAKVFIIYPLFFSAHNVSHSQHMELTTATRGHKAHEVCRCKWAITAGHRAAAASSVWAAEVAFMTVRGQSIDKGKK